MQTKTSVRSKRAATQLTRKAKIALLSLVVRGYYQGSYFMMSGDVDIDAVLAPRSLSEALALLDDRGLLRGRRSSQEHWSERYKAASELVQAAVRQPIHRRLARIRRSAKRGSVEKSINSLIEELRIFQLAPAVFGTSIAEFESLKRLGYVARIRRTIATLRAYKGRVLTHSSMSRMGELDELIKKAGAAPSEFGFESGQDFNEFRRGLAVRYLKARAPKMSGRWLQAQCSACGVTDESLGLEPGSTAKRVADEVRRAEEVDAYWAARRQSDASPPDGSWVKQQLEMLRQPDRADTELGLDFLRGEIRRKNLKLEDIGTSEAELDRFAREAPLRRARELAKWYANGQMQPMRFFAELKRLGITPVQVGVDAREQELLLFSRRQEKLARHRGLVALYHDDFDR